MYIILQDNICCHCGNDLSDNPVDKVVNAKINWNLFPPNFTKHPIHLHHSHDTGMTIGAVHALCNAYLWQYCGE